jgi:hypothetical protein
MDLTVFQGQNSIITPAALAFGEQPPASIQDQKWLLVLTGVVTANLKGSSTSQWLNTNVSFLPDMAGPSNSGPLNWAIANYGIPKPPGQDYTIAFALDEWAPFVALSAIFDQDQSIDAGFAVNVWRPNHFATGFDVLTHAPLGNIFTGVNVDVGVRDSDAWILSFSYNITLRGRIVFPVTAIIVFESNFESTPVMQPPATIQAVGIAASLGSIEVISPSFLHTGNWLQVGPYEATTGLQFKGIFTGAPGLGVYVFTAMMFMSSKPASADANIGFNDADGTEFLNLNLRPDNHVYISVDATSVTYPRDQPFAIQVTLALTTTLATVQIAVGGAVENISLHSNPFTCSQVTLYQEIGHAGGPFDVTDMLVTYTAL